MKLEIVRVHRSDALSQLGELRGDPVVVLDQARPLGAGLAMIARDVGTLDHDRRVRARAAKGVGAGIDGVVPNAQPCGVADRELYLVARHIEKHEIDGILMVGGWSGYVGAAKLHAERERFPAFHLPIVCLPASINNNLPGSELSIGSDSALNNIVGAADKIKTSAVASQRCFVVEVMGAAAATCSRAATRAAGCRAGSTVGSG